MSCAETKPLRLFAAVLTGVEVREEVLAAQGRLRERLGDGPVRWVTPEQVHLTLRFYGAVPAERLAELSELFHDAVGTCQPLELVLGELGAFPSLRRPRVLWVGLEGDLPRLRALQDAVVRATRGFGIEQEEKPFQPHLTLGRVRVERGSGIAEALAGVLPARRARWPIGEAHLVQSELGPNGARHHSVCAAPLQALDS